MRYLLFSLLLILPLLSFSQRGGLRNLSADSIATLNTNRMTDSLSLSAAQAAKVFEVNLEFEKNRKFLRKESQGDWQAMRGKMTALRTAHREALGKYLTADQENQWKRIQMANREKMKAERMGRGPRGSRGAKGEGKKRKPVFNEVQKEKTELKINN